MFSCEELDQAKELIKKAYSKREFPFFFVSGGLFSDDTESMIFLKDGTYIIAEHCFNWDFDKKTDYPIDIQYQTIDNCTLVGLTTYVALGQNIKDFGYFTKQSWQRKIANHPKVVALLENLGAGDIFSAMEENL